MSDNMDAIRQALAQRVAILEVKLGAALHILEAVQEHLDTGAARPTIEGWLKEAKELLKGKV